MKMTVMWSASSFCNYLLNFLNKYLEGSIFQNNYFEGAAGIIATIVGASVYARLGKRRSFVISFSLALCGGIVIYLLESGTVLPPQSLAMAYSGTLKTRNHKAVGYLIPKVTFIAKFGIALAFLCTYQASFSDDTLFPVSMRATAIGTCQLFARGLTILAPEITELPSPEPIMFFVAITCLALIVAYNFEESPKKPTEGISASKSPALILKEKNL